MYNVTMARIASQSTWNLPKWEDLTQLVPTAYQPVAAMMHIYTSKNVSRISVQNDWLIQMLLLYWFECVGRFHDLAISYQF